MAATMIMLLGVLLVALVNQTWAPFLFAVLFVVLGLTLCRGLGKHEQRFFGLSFAVCVFVTGLSQIYAQMVFGHIQTGWDASLFYNVSTRRFWRNVADIDRETDGAVAVFVWNRLYTLNTMLGFENGPWLGVLFNGFLVGLSSGLTIQTARYVVGSDAGRLKLLGILFAMCGMFWVFGTLHLRDSFTLFAQTLLMYGFVRALALPQIFNGILLSTILSVVTLSSFYLREEGVPLIAVFCVLGLTSWTRDKKHGSVRLFLLLIVGFMLTVIFLDKVVLYQEYAVRKISSIYMYYKELVEQSRPSGLAYTWVVNPPPLVRLFTGSVYMYIHPIPLWRYFTPIAGEYQWIKSYHGLYLAAVAPFGFVGIYTALKQTLLRGPSAPPLCFLALSTIVTLFAVVMTSLEVRHLGQFLPAFLILSVLPDRREPRVRSQLKLCCVIWYGAVVVVHFLWVVLKNF